jgi:hypothetical protein
MANYKSTRQLAVADAAYIAGLIDGEGTVTLTRRHANQNREIAVCIANNELPILQFVHARIGAGRITRKRTHSVRHSPAYCYAISNRQALALLRQIVPFLHSHKRQRTEIVLSRYLQLTPRNGKYTAALKAERTVFEQDVLAISSRLRPLSGLEAVASAALANPAVGL